MMRAKLEVNTARLKKLVLLAEVSNASRVSTASRTQTPISLPLDTEVARLLVIPTPPLSPLSLWLSPLPQIPSPPLPLIPSPLPQIPSPPLPSILSPLPALPPLPVLSPPPLASPTYPLGYRATMIRLRSKTPFTSHPIPSSTPLLLPILLPTPSPPLLLPSTDHRADVHEVWLLPRKRLYISIGPRYEVGESSYAPTARPTRGFRADYGFVATLDDEIRRDLERDVGYGITDTWDEMLMT
ncbi:hypothetical protein Tco_0572326 [Tanacetum coccineum]